MTSKEYWRKREEEQAKHNIRTEEEYLKVINGYYERMMDQIQKEINGFYGKYAKAEGITIAEAKKRVEKVDIEEYGRKAARYVKEKNFSKQANAEMRLYNLTMKVNRLEMLKANIGLELVSGFDDLQKYFEQILTERTMEEFERQAGILESTIQDNAKDANSIVNASFHNAKFSDRIWMYQEMMKSELSKLLQEGLIQGRNPRQLARHLRKLFGVSQYNAERLIRTELARVQIEAQRRSLKESGFEEYEFIALGNACDICRALDGKHFKIDKLMPGENAPPMHPNCRCSVAAHMDDAKYEEWLDSLDKKGNTRGWNPFKKTQKTNEKEESKRKYRYKNTVVNTSEIRSSGYRKKYTDITGENKISRLLWENALDILDHRSGTRYEDLSFIDSKTGKFKINKNYNKENAALPSKEMNKMLREADAKTIIAIHNHPGSSVPSLSDIVACKNRGYKYGLVACHDGTIYKYSVDEKKFNMPMAASALDRMLKKGYTETTRKECLDAGIKMEVF